MPLVFSRDSATSNGPQQLLAQISGGGLDSAVRWLPRKVSNDAAELGVPAAAPSALQASETGWPEAFRPRGATCPDKSVSKTLMLSKGVDKKH